ncbi:MAG: hypothetical protein OHK0046_10220 [Anaerolineae bacterium]
MSLELVVFLALVFTTFYINAVQWYTQVESYPLMTYVGAQEYRAYGQFYERRLVFALYIPYLVQMLSNLFLIFSRPEGLATVWFIIAFLANLSIMVLSLTLAVPVHKKHAAQGFITDDGVRAVLRVNLLRLAAACLSSGIMLYLLAELLTRTA